MEGMVMAKKSKKKSKKKKSRRKTSSLAAAMTHGAAHHEVAPLRIVQRKGKTSFEVGSPHFEAGSNAPELGPDGKVVIVWWRPVTESQAVATWTRTGWLLD